LVVVAAAAAWSNFTTDRYGFGSVLSLSLSKDIMTRGQWISMG
jgi:hypothetical protein